MDNTNSDNTNNDNNIIDPNDTANVGVDTDQVAATIIGQDNDSNNTIVANQEENNITDNTITITAKLIDNNDSVIIELNELTFNANGGSISETYIFKPDKLEDTESSGNKIFKKTLKKKISIGYSGYNNSNNWFGQKYVEQGKNPGNISINRTPNPLLEDRLYSNPLAYKSASAVAPDPDPNNIDNSNSPVTSNNIDNSNTPPSSNNSANPNAAPKKSYGIMKGMNTATKVLGTGLNVASKLIFRGGKKTQKLKNKKAKTKKNQKKIKKQKSKTKKYKSYVR